MQKCFLVHEKVSEISISNREGLCGGDTTTNTKYFDTEIATVENEGVEVRGVNG